MFIVSGTYIIKAGLRDEFMDAIESEGIPAANRAEQGNLGYDYFYPYGDELGIYFVERWQDQDAWEAHKIAPHVIKLQDIKAKYMQDFIPGILGEICE